MASRESFSIRNRVEFDEFWMSGIERGQLQELGFLESLSRPASEADRQSATGTFEVTNPLDDPPVTAQVWWKYATEPDGSEVDLLIDPGRVVAPSGRQQTTGLSSSSAVRMLRKHVIDEQVSLESTLMLAGFGFIAIRLTYQDMVTRLLPLTRWRDFLQEAKSLSPEGRRSAMRAFRGMETAERNRGRTGWFLHLLAICGQQADRQPAITYGEKSPALARMNQLLDMVRQPQEREPIGRVTLNRPMKASVSRSQRTVKVDATRGLFDVRCDTLRWAVVDSGIDARHDWFRALNPADNQPWPNPFENSGTVFNYTRIVEAFDFTRQRTSAAITHRPEEAKDWERVELPGDVPIALALGERFYEPPRNGHGTHVAGIIGGTGGLCPDIQLYDYRVLDEDARGNEFAVVTALRYILEITQRASHSDPTGRNRDIPIHGVNLSVALDADVTSDACGWSLICRVCDELVRAGVVVVVAAGNTGFEDRSGALVSRGQDYRTVSITDPGNTERVITVGSTDADRPREYGVSYFSARGPTADGRAKPDLVAPGNSITSAYGYKRDQDDRRNAAATLNGTSMAAAHVSGCAALLMARHRELIGKPDEVKRTLMQTATDLQRDRNFQGAGLVDALRAVQSI
jgi:Subtilase family